MTLVRRLKSCSFTSLIFITKSLSEKLLTCNKNYIAVVFLWHLEVALWGLSFKQIARNFLSKETMQGLVWSPELFIHEGAIAYAGFYYWQNLRDSWNQVPQLIWTKASCFTFLGGWSLGKVRLYTRDKANYWTKYNVDRNIPLLSPLFIYYLFIYLLSFSQLLLGPSRVSLM